MTQHPEMRNTEFGRTLVELLDRRGLEVTPFAVGKLAEETGLDGWAVIGRMANADADLDADLGGLADRLELSESEMTELALAFTFEGDLGRLAK